MLKNIIKCAMCGHGIHPEKVKGKTEWVHDNPVIALSIRDGYAFNLHFARIPPGIATKTVRRDYLHV